MKNRSIWFGSGPIFLDGKVNFVIYQILRSKPGNPKSYAHVIISKNKHNSDRDSKNLSYSHKQHLKNNQNVDRVGHQHVYK